MPTEYVEKTNLLTGEVQKKLVLVCPDQGVTIQAESDATNIHRIMANYGRTQELTHIAANMPTFGDFTNSPSMQEALNQIIAGKEEFMKLPADVRAHCKNDPAVFIEFIEDPANRELHLEFNLVTPTKEEKATARRIRQAKRVPKETPVPPTPPTEVKSPPAEGGDTATP